MNIKPGSVNQQPLYGCKGCYEDYSCPAGDLRVHEGECWCDLCWGERRWDFPDLPYWDDLEPYTPAEQQPAPDVSGLVEALEDIRSRSSMNLAMNPNPFELTAMLGDIHQIAGAALAEESSND